MGLLKRKSRNRRHRRGHVLDVKLRSSKTRAARLRLLGTALMVTFCTLLSLFILWRAGEWVLDQLVYKNNAFAVRRMEVVTDGVIAPDQLKVWSGVKPGDNLLALDLARVKRDLELVPAIESVLVERVLPDTLRVRVIERHPVARVVVPLARPSNAGLNMGIIYLDAHGSVMLPIEPHHRSVPPSAADEALPFISGLNPAQLVPGKRVESPQIRAALELLAEFERSKMVGLVDLQRIDVSSPAILHLTTDQGNEITFGAEDLPRQLRRWREIYDRALRLQKTIATLDLSVPNNIPLTLKDGRPDLPERTRSQTQPSNRRRNV